MARIMARTPVIALDYAERHKAVPKELLIDYGTGNIYVVSKDDKSVIFDITSKIFEQLENMSGDNIEITIEGIGTVNLTQIINELRQDIADSVQVIETGEDIHYIGRENILDNKSITVVNRNIQLQGFSSAEKHMIPRKSSDGTLEWINMPMYPDSGTGGAPDVIPPSNPDNGSITEVYLIEPVNDKLYLRASRRQKSINIDRNCIVVLPRVLDNFSEVEWYVMTNSFAPMLKFTSNVVWANVTTTQPKENSHQVYKFKTWDAGENWLAELVQYNRAANEETIDIKYLEENYFNKTEIINNHYTKEEVDQRIDEINTLDPSNYYSKQETHDRYYDKQQVDDIIADLDFETVDLTNYYNKQEVDSKIDRIPTVNPENYYNKEEIEAGYYNKVQVGNMIDEVKGEIPNVDEFITRTEVSNNHYNKQEVDNKIADIVVPDVDLSGYVTDVHLTENYYNKGEVDELVASIPPSNGEGGTIDLTNYYTKRQTDDKFMNKTELSENYYNKQEIADKHYDKEQTNELISWKTGGMVQSKLPKNKKR